jgi:hypothetical protein
MDIISLEKIYPTEEHIKSQIGFFELFINDRSLSDILTEFYEFKDEHLLDNWALMIGGFQRYEADEHILIKRLLFKKISETDIRNVYPPDITEKSMQEMLEYYYKDFLVKDPIIYGCCICGQEGCGGFDVKISKNEDCNIWTFIHFNENTQLQFHFDKYQYFQVFDEYNKMQREKHHYKFSM